MADWSQLHKDLLHEIHTHVSSPFSTVRLRSICSSWRHAIKSNGHNHPSTKTLPISLHKRTILLLTPPHANPTPWIIKLDPLSPQRFNLYYPLSKQPVIPYHNELPGLLDVLNVRFLELGCEYIMGFMSGDGTVGDGLLYAEKIAFLDIGNGDFMLLCIHVSGNLAVFSSVSMKWVDFDGVGSTYDDVIAFNGAFYAVDNVGRTVVVDVSEVSVSIVANFVGGGDKKRLVEMCGELMLVDVYISLPPDCEDVNLGSDLDDFVAARSIWFKVYRLDRERQEWVEVKDLGKYVLFLGVNSAFAVNSGDLGWDRGNCICFNFPQCFCPLIITDEDYDDVVRYFCGGVFDLKDSSISYSKLFWPPPSWVTSSS